MQGRKGGVQAEPVAEREQAGDLDVGAGGFVVAAVVAVERRDDIERVPAAAQEDHHQRIGRVALLRESDVGQPRASHRGDGGGAALQEVSTGKYGGWHKYYPCFRRPGRGWQ